MPKNLYLLILGLVVGIFIGIAVGQILVQKDIKRTLTQAVVGFIDSQAVISDYDRSVEEGLLPAGAAQGIWDTFACKIGNRWIWNDERFDRPEQCEGGGGSCWCGYERTAGRVICGGPGCGIRAY